MATGKLYTYPDNPRAFKVLIAGAYSGANITAVQDPPEFTFGETNKSDDFLRKFPLGKVPAFESSDGLCLSESNAIAYYVANSQLRGLDPEAQSQVLMYVNLGDSEILPAASNWVFPTLGIMQFNKSNTERAKEEIKNVLHYLNNVLSTRTFLVGERVTLADISLACNFILLYKNVLDPAFRAPYPHVNRWFLTVVNQPQAKGVLGDIKLCEKMAQFDAKKYAELSGKKDSKKEGKKENKKVEKPAKEAKPVDDEDDAPPPAPKQDPFADMPPPSMDMDAFKRSYSNENIEKQSIPYFWEKFDREQYSIWKCDYKYSEELQKLFMTSNLIGGMMQRLDKVRKYAFGIMCIFGEDNNNNISGLWFWRGTNLIFDRCEDWSIDSPSYTWTKLDPDSPDTKKLVLEYFVQEGDVDSKGEVVSCKVFK